MEMCLPVGVELHSTDTRFVFLRSEGIAGDPVGEASVEIGAGFTLIEAEVDDSIFPVRFSRGSFLFDPRPGQPFMYLASVGFGVTVANKSWWYKINRITKTVVLQAKTGSRDNSTGVPDIDSQGRIYWVADGGLTLVFQRLGRFSGDTLDFIDYAYPTTPSGPTDYYTIASGTFRVDRHSPSHLWWHCTNTDQNNGDISIFSQDTMNLITYVPRADFDSVSGTILKRTNDMDCDDNGNLYCAQSYPSNPGGAQLRLWKVTPTGTVSLEYDFSTFIQGILGPGFVGGWVAVKWIGADHSLIFYIADQIIKYDIATQTILGTLTVKDTIENRSSFHRAGDELLAQPRIWLGYVIVDNTQPVGPGGLKFFPTFQAIDPVNLVITQTETNYAVGLTYPLLDEFGGGTQKPFFSPVNALYDYATDCVWSEEISELVVGEFCFSTPPVIMVGCLPVGVDLHTTDTRAVFLRSE